MKKLFLIVIVVVIFGCSGIPEPTMTYGKSVDYEKLREETKNQLLYLSGYDGYEVLLCSDDIRILDYKIPILGISVYKDFNVIMENDGDPVLLKNIPQGIKVIDVYLISDVDNLPKTTSKHTKNTQKRRLLGKIYLHVGIGGNNIFITNPEEIYVQHVTNVGDAVSLKKGNEKKSFQSLEEIMNDFDDFRKKSRE